MGALGGWLLALIAASVLCAAADGMIPSGPVKGVGRLVCGLVLLCTILSPLARLDLTGGVDWLEDYFRSLDLTKETLAKDVNAGQEAIIVREYEAYIGDKAAQLGLTCAVRVTCREENGLLLPHAVHITGLTPQEGEALRLWEELGVPPERQYFEKEEEGP